MSDMQRDQFSSSDSGNRNYEAKQANTHTHIYETLFFFTMF